MSLLVPSGSNSHEPLPSLPPSPTEEDLGGVAPWREVDPDDERDENRSPSAASLKKGKGKARDVERDDTGSVTPPLPEGGYPPTAEEEAEARKVAETLRRWEHSERQRRKAARDSAASSTPSSVVESMTKRASLLWPARNMHAAVPNGAAIHTALRQTSDDALPLNDLGAPSPGASKPPSPTSMSLSMRPPGDAVAPHESSDTATENPFEPPNSATPLRAFPSDSANSANDDVRPDETEPLTPATAKASAVSPFADPSTPQQQWNGVPDSQYPKHPPPRPLDIPPPKTPPPRVKTPHSSTPQTAKPRTPMNWNQPASSSQSRAEPEHRWWTDWLCGCREGGDDDDQAGRTNPFE